MLDWAYGLPAATAARTIAFAPIAAGPAPREAAKTYLRIDGTLEDAALDALAAVAIGHGERFLARVLLTRTATETLPADGGWTRLIATPVRGIAAVAALAGDGTATPLPAAAYQTDIDAAGDGWLRTIDAGGARVVQATLAAGIASGWGGLPEPIAQGIVRLTAHLFSHRDAADEGAPPAAVAALWRPWRRMRLA